jgi:hypothetical protein
LACANYKSRRAGIGDLIRKRVDTATASSHLLSPRAKLPKVGRTPFPYPRTRKHLPAKIE